MEPAQNKAETQARRPGILRLALPVVISFGLRSIYSLVDSAFAANLEGVGDASVAAIGFTVPLEFLMTACWVGTSNGLTAQLSAAIGAGESERVAALKRATVKIVFALVALFLAVAVGIWLTATEIGLEEAAGRQLQVYATVLIAGQALTAFWSILPDSLVKAHHDMKSLMWAGIISGFTNVALNALFVYPFGWGIFGIALSTVVSRLFSLAYANHRAGVHERARLSKESERVDTKPLPEFSGSAVRQILFISIPSALSFVLMAFESLAVNWIVKSTPSGDAHSSTLALAAWSMYDRGARFLAMPLIAIGVAMLSLVARLWGERDIASIRRQLRSAGLFGIGYVIVLVTPLMLLFGDEIAGFFTESADASELTRTGMLWLPIATFAAAPFFVVRSAFEGMGKPRPGMVISAARVLALTVPLTWIGVQLAPELGFSALIGAFAGSCLGTLLGSGWMVLWMTRELTRVERQFERDCEGPRG